jgi:Undecaprenyl-phosphate glucose phosphotransferase
MGSRLVSRSSAEVLFRRARPAEAWARRLRRISPFTLALMIVGLDLLATMLAGPVALLVAPARGTVGEFLFCAVFISATIVAIRHQGGYRPDALLRGAAIRRAVLPAWIMGMGAASVLVLATDFVGGLTFAALQAREAGPPLSSEIGRMWLTFAALHGVDSASPSSLDIGRTWAGATVLVALPLLCALRAAASLALGGMLRGEVALRMVLVGFGGADPRLALLAADDSATRIVGVLGPDAEALGYRHVPDLEALVAMIRRSEVDLVAIDASIGDTIWIEDVIQRLGETPVDVRLIPDAPSIAYLSSPVSYLCGLPLLHVLDQPISGAARIAKKAEDMVLALGALVLLAPLMLLAAIAIKLDSPGPVLFRQKRYGYNNRIIWVLKFRTMHVAYSDAVGASQAVRNDPRVTRVGRWLRRFSVDELPQLLNVLNGEMSIVGPRPHAVATRAAGLLFEQAVADYMARHRVKPGITGWAQVNGWRGETDTVEKLQRRIECDLYYIRNWSLALDLHILLRTVRCVVPHRNAF